METLNNFNQVFWSEKFWLPSNITWNAIASQSERFAEPKDLWWPIPLSFMLLVLRYLMEKHIFEPVGNYLAIKNVKPAPPSPNKTLEEQYNISRRLTPHRIDEVSKKLDVSPQTISRWWRRKRAQDRPTTLKKFCETCWKGFYYTSSFAYGCYIMWDHEYFWDFKLSLLGYPRHPLTTSIWYYYMISLSFYWSSTFMHFFEAKRKDFWEMLAHHIITIFLISYSWACNFHRVGSLILVVHDCADILMEVSKSLKYAKFDRTCEVVFAVFSITWLVTRLVVYPQIVYVTLVYLPVYPARLLCNALLFGLLGLHCYWTYLLFQLLKTVLVTKKIEGDTRSDSDDDEISDENPEDEKKIN